MSQCSALVETWCSIASVTGSSLCACAGTRQQCSDSVRARPGGGSRNLRTSEVAREQVIFQECISVLSKQMILIASPGMARGGLSGHALSANRDKDLLNLLNLTC
eukprot:4541107-Pleurochrysis_carterae.AAC.4